MSILTLISASAQKYPRTYYSATFVFVPHFILNILICIAFGSLIAYFETGAEQKNNDLILAQVARDYENRSTANYLFEHGPKLCVETFLAENDIDVTNITSSVSIDVVEMLESVEQCGSDFEEEYAMPDDFFNASPNYTDTKFGFTTCPYKEVIPEENRTKTKERNYHFYVYHKWNETYWDSHGQYTAEGKDFREASELARNEASGHEGCTMNYLGGTIFFFTVLTTIGYGTYTLQTTEARIVVYICGFFSILWFTATSAMAGTVVITMFDDWATRHDYPSLTRGFSSVLFWFAVFVCEILACATVTKLYTRYELDDKYELSYEDSLWFSYITLTTVGFGDIALLHQQTNLGWFIAIYSLILSGFTTLATFLLKLKVFVASKVASLNRKTLLFVDELEEYLKDKSEIIEESNNEVNDNLEEILD